MDAWLTPVRSLLAAGLEILHVLGGQALAAHAPLAALELFDEHPRDGAHRLALDVDHRLGEAGDHLLLLVLAEHAFDELHLDERHIGLPCSRASGRWWPATSVRRAGCVPRVNCCTSVLQGVAG